jgi:hypothetical protein
MSNEYTDQGVVVPTDASGGKMNAGIAPTTTSTVDQNQIPSNSVTTAPSTTSTRQPTAAQNPTQTATPQPQPVKPHPVSSMFDGILKNLSGGPIVVTDPTTGDRREVPQSRGTMAKSILAAALAGLMTPTRYRDTPYGPVVDNGNTIAGAAAAGVASRQAREDKAQQLTNAQQAAKLMTIQNNAKLVQLQAASAHSKHVMLDEQNQDAQTFLSPFKEYEAIRTADQPSAFVAQNLSAQDILKPGSPYKLTDSNVVRDGTRTVFNPQTQQDETEPTYAVLNPALGDIQLPPEVTNKLNEINSQWKDIHKVVGGTVRVPINAYVSAMHDYQSVTQGEHILNTLNQEINGDKAAPISLAPAIRANRPLLQTLNTMEQAVAAGNTPGTRPENVLDSILKAPNGGDLLKLLGMTPTQADQYIQKQVNDRARAAKLASEGGIGDKSPMDATKVAQLPAMAKQLGLTPAQTEIAIGKLNPNGVTVGEYNTILSKMQDQANKNREFASNNPTPSTASRMPAGFVMAPDAMAMDTPTLQRELQSKGVEIPSDFAALYKVAHNAADLKSTFPSNRRRGVNQMTQSEALSYIQNFINPAYQESDYSAAQGLNKELASTKVGTAGGSLLAAGTAANHLSLLDEAAKALNNRDVQKVNQLANYLGVQVGNSPAITFKAIADQVNNEVGKVVAGGGTVHQAELNELRENLNSNQSPEQTAKVIKSYIALMSGRMSEINERSQQYFGRDVKGTSPEAAKVFAKYGFDAPGYVRVQIPGQPVGSISKNQLDAFRKKYPNATTVVQ